MSQRFYCPQVIASQQMVQLDGQEAHHLLHVMRAKVGTEVFLFDGQGREFKAMLTDLGRSTVDLTIMETDRSEIDIQADADVRLALGVALPKGDRQRFLVEKCVELGVTQLVPLETERSVAMGKSSSLDRLRRTVIEACKQCGRNRLMEIAEPSPFAEFLEAAPPSAPSAGLQWIADPTGTTSAAQRWKQQRGSHANMPLRLAACVGPEGGFSQAELDHAQALGWEIVRLGRWILRVETAALALAAMVQGDGT